VKRQVNFFNGDRNYGHLQAIKTGNKPQLDLLVIGMLGRAHITFVSNDADHMREVWHINETFQIPYNPVADVDGDGRLELVYTRSNADGEAPTSGNVTMIARDLLTGEVRHERAQSRLLGLQDLDGDGVSEMIVTSVPDDKASILRAFDEAIPLPVSGRQLCLVADRPPLHMMNEALADRSGYQPFTQDIDHDGLMELFATTADGLVAIDPRSHKIELKYNPDPRRLSLPVAIGRVGGSGDGALMLTEDFDLGLAVISPQGHELARVDVNESTPRTAVAARLGQKKQMTLLATKPNGTLVALAGPGLAAGRAEAIWERPGTGGFVSASVVHIEKDDDAQVLACVGESAEPVILDASGRVLRRFAGLPSDGTAFVSGTGFVGQFGDPPRTAIGAVSAIGPNDEVARLTIFDALSGDVLWQRDGGPAPQRTPCVVDVNSDGVDDLVWIHYFDLVAADGRTGETLWAVNDRVPGYHVVSAADVDGSGTMSLLLTGGYMCLYRFDLSGNQVWASEPLNYNAGSAAALADVDGDGHLEFGTAFTDRFACYDAATGQVKWTISLPGQGSDVAAVDINGNGREDFVFGCTDGNLYAVEAPPAGSTGVVLWKAFLGAPVGPPVVADLNSDGGAEIIVATLDGGLHVLAAPD
jgi:outer membrane protein assembly factor BamB